MKFFPALSVVSVAWLVVLMALSSTLCRTVDASNSAVRVPSQSTDSYSHCSWARPTQGADVRKDNNSVTITAFGPMPLLEAINAVNRRYEWSVNFEEPISSSPFDLCEKDGTLWFSGTIFRTAYTEADNVKSLSQEEAILDKIVSDYNKTKNPGKFSVRKYPSGRLTIAPEYVRGENGELVKSIPILDAPVSPMTQTQRVYQFIQEIVNQVNVNGISIQASAAIGYPSNANSTTAVGGTTLPAEELLNRVLEAGGTRISWGLEDCTRQMRSNEFSCLLEFSPSYAIPNASLVRAKTTTEYENKFYGISLTYPSTFEATNTAPPIQTGFSLSQNADNRPLVTIAIPPRCVREL
jgi:hypothetical protein